MRPQTCHCEKPECPTCKARAYGRAWRAKHSHYMRDYYDARHPEAAQRRYYGRRDWTADEDSLLGTDRDSVVAEVLERGYMAVSNRRRKLRIPAYREPLTERNARHVHKGRYIVVALTQDDPYHDMTRHKGYVLEHRYVMAQHLGRPLTTDEVVHHRNGVKHDNRIENLELWTNSHPTGQRVEDKLAWAREFIERYELDASFADTMHKIHADG